MDILLFLPGVLLLFVLLPAIVPAVLWDFTAFIIFLATLKSHEEKHKKAEKMFVISSAVLTITTAAAAVCYLLIMLIADYAY